MLSYSDIEQTVDSAMYDNGVVLCEQDVENATLVYENDWGNWALEEVDGQFDLVAIDGRVIENLEDYEDTDQLYADVVQFLEETFSA